MPAQPLKIAIVGMAGLFPGAPGPEALWGLILARRSAARPVPPERWVVAPERLLDPAIGKPDHLYSTTGCFLEPFDVELDGLAVEPSLVAALDPLHRLVLRVGTDAWRSAVTPGLDRRRVAVILANIALPTEATSALARTVIGGALAERVLGRPAAIAGLGAAALDRHPSALPAGLLAQALGLGGGSYTLDAACASSLYALRLACAELGAGRIDAALAGGASRPQCLYTQVGFSQLQALSPSGRCAPFDSRADGLVVGEGAGIFVLKRLDDAVAAGDRILGVIRAVGLSNDVGGSLLSPEREGQLRAMRAAYAAAGWSPSEVQLIECHGTGTPRGDAVELSSLRALWEGERGSAVIGSVKSNVGHLLTAAGAAGLTKLLLALGDRTLPPTAAFSADTAAEGLEGSPFKVLEAAREWRDSGKPRRAALSAFGFGGINAHLLLEEHRTPRGRRRAPPPERARAGKPPAPIAIVGMGAQLGSLSELRSFGEAVLRGTPLRDPRPPARWRGLESSSLVRSRGLDGPLPGGWVSKVELPAGRFRIPPRELPSLLPQQLLMLRVAAEAVEDAGARGDGLTTGCVIGLGLDLETTSFHLRWLVADQLQRWAAELGLSLTAEEEAAWGAELSASLGPALDAPRTLGALGGIVASRVAREFSLGGPSFALSGEEGSGLRALEVAARLLQAGEVDRMIAGAVELGGDLRQLLASDELRRFSRSGEARPFDAGADGPVPGEGACAVVLKRLDDAVRDGDRIYAVIRGLGAAGGGGSPGKPAAESYGLALSRAYEEAGIDPATVSLLETSAGGDPVADRLEAEALHRFFPAAGGPRCALGAVKAVIGDAGAAASLASVVKSALCLFHELLPPLPGLRAPLAGPAWEGGPFHFPREPQPWLRDRAAGPRRAGVSAISVDGCCLHAVLEGQPRAATEHAAVRARPLGDRGVALFLLHGADDVALAAAASSLRDRSARAVHGIEPLAAGWYRSHGAPPPGAKVRALVATTPAELAAQLAGTASAAATTSSGGAAAQPGGTGAAAQLAGAAPAAATFPGAGVAFVFPGSGNHYVGMGRSLGAALPAIYRALDSETEQLASQLGPRLYAPWRSSWGEGSELEAATALTAAPEQLILGQVAHGVAVSDAVRLLGVTPTAWLGYSLGETAALFASRAWTARDEMFRRTLASPLFRTELSGPCEVAAKLWGVPAADWHVVVVNRPAAAVRAALAGTAALLIVNAPLECVVGGRRGDVEATVEALGCEALALAGVPTVHCKLVEPVAGAYRALHELPTSPLSGATFYSAAWARPYVPGTASCADSILADARDGFDFPALIERAYADGVRVFVEPGPQGSCSRMIGKILAGRPHLAVAACVKGQDGFRSLLVAIGRVAEAGVQVELSALYGPAGGIPLAEEREAAERRAMLVVPVGGPAIVPPLPPASAVARSNLSAEARLPASPLAAPDRSRSAMGPDGAAAVLVEAARPAFDEGPAAQAGPASRAASAGGAATTILANNALLARGVLTNAEATAAAHGSFLRLSADRLTLQLATLDRHSALLAGLHAGGSSAAGLLRASQPGTAPLSAVPARARPPGASRLAPAPSSAPLARARPPGGPSAPMPVAAATPVTAPTPVTAATPVAAPAPIAASAPVAAPVAAATAPPPFLDRAACLEFAVGAIGKVLGPDFAAVDAHPSRVRLPAEPLMLCDRMISVEGTPLSLSRGRLVTEHDVLPGAFYLDAGRAPVCISVEAGQADLFLCAYLGIDLQTRGERVYRLLDAQIVFHRELPRVGEVLRYDIRIDRFLRQGDTWLFFFHFEGYASGEPLLSMRDGCAGFFTTAQLDGGRGIVGDSKQRDLPRRTGADGAPSAPFTALVPVEPCSLDDAAVDALRRGELATAFGPLFAGKVLPAELRLPGGKLRLVHRILELDPAGGRHGLGTVLGEADVAPDDWYLTCHFPDDPVMPGTLMYECCLHTLRVLLLRLGWIGAPGAGSAWQPVIGAASKLRCRGQVTPATRTVGYRIDLKEIGYDPEPYVLAEASMYADGRHVVEMEGMSLRLSGVTREELEAVWASPAAPVKPAFDRDRLTALCEGRPSDAFGPEYAPFDHGRRLARLPRAPFAFLDRVLTVDAPPRQLVRAGWVTCDTAIPADAWYLAASRQPRLPYAVLLEAALQPCGWLAAYGGAAFLSETDLLFRNLDGTGTVHAEPLPGAGPLVQRARLTSCSQAGGMILVGFDMELLQDGKLCFSGQTGFGFFPERALAEQVGLRGAVRPEVAGPGRSLPVPKGGPRDPAAALCAPRGSGLSLPATAWSMLDRIRLHDAGPGPVLLVGEKWIDPAEWFFQAHFFQDPVMPGSLGCEALVELLKSYLLDRFPALAGTHRFEALAVGRQHAWSYRGQVLPTSREVVVEAAITSVDDGPEPVVTADGFLVVDGRTIYALKKFAVRAVREAP